MRDIVWSRDEEYRFLRAADAAIALSVEREHLADACGVFAVVRLLATMLDASTFGSSDPVGMLGAASSALANNLPALRQAASDEPAVRELLRRALTGAIDDDFRPDSRELSEEINGHPLWQVFALDPFARRLRLLARNQGTTLAALARSLTVPEHQVRHWSVGDSKPAAEHRRQLAAALRVHEDWFGPRRDRQVDAGLYRFRSCPCATGADLRPGPLDDVPGYEGAGLGMWCAGCGQPLLVSVSGWFYPVPLAANSSAWAPVFNAVGDTCGAGSELGRPWPHAEWIANPDPHAGKGGHRIPPRFARPLAWV